MSGISRWFNQTFQVSRKTTSDSFGIEGWSDVGVIMGFIQPVAGGLATTRGKVSAQNSYRLYCPADSDVDAGDRVTDVYGRNMIAMFVQSQGISGVEDHMEIDLEDES